jgi:hypothetical protein
MRTFGKTAIALAALICSVAASTEALADRDGHRGGYRGGHHGGYRGHHHGDGGHWSGSFVVGVPLYGPGYGYGYYGRPWRYAPAYPYGYPDPVVVIRERSEVPEIPSGPPPQQYWYYCASARGYYPYVGSCPEQWRAVPATPPASP